MSLFKRVVQVKILLLLFAPLFIYLGLPTGGVASETPFKIVYASAWPPYSEGTNRDVQGILPSLMEDLISKRMGVPVEHIGVPWARAQDMVKKGLVDAFVTTPTPERLAYAISSNEYVYSVEFNPVVKIGSKIHARMTEDVNIPVEIANYRFCDVLGNNWAKHYYNKYNINYFIAKDAEVCVKMINAGRLDIFIHPANVAKRAIEKLNLMTSFEIYGAVAESPKFTLLLSKKSHFGATFLKNFDDALHAEKAKGAYKQLLSLYRKKYQK